MACSLLRMKGQILSTMARSRLACCAVVSLGVHNESEMRHTAGYALINLAARF